MKKLKKACHKSKIRNQQSKISLVRFLKLTSLITIAATALILAKATAEPLKFSEYQIKAGFIFNFTRFVKWPAESYQEDPAFFNLCILGKDPFNAYFDSVEGKTVKGRDLVVKRIKNINKAFGCQILFISGSEKDRMPFILGSLEGRNILTVGDTPGFIQQGGVINLVMKGERVLFETNSHSARRAGLYLSSELLKLSITTRANN